MNQQIERFLQALRESDFFIPYIYKFGACYQLYRILKVLYPEAEAYVKEFDSPYAHVITKVDGQYYDIDGLVDIEVVKKNHYRKMTPEEEKYANEKWSFYKNNDLYYGECIACGEPIRIDKEKLTVYDKIRRRIRV